MKSIFKNVSYTFIANIIGVIISVIITFLTPRILNVESYGYLQLYLFYAGYMGFFHFGWADGVFLRYGGEYYEKLDKPCLGGQFWLYTAVEVMIGLTIAVIGRYFASPQERKLVFILTGVSVIIILPKTLLQYILQSTNRIKEYATITVLDRLVYGTLVAAYLYSGGSGFIGIIIADLAGKGCSLLYSIYQCRDILCIRPEPLHAVMTEARENISAGVKLMFSNMASTFIIGFVRFSIEKKWDVSTFGKVSLTMLVSNMLMLFIRAVAQVMFPTLRRTSGNKLNKIYSALRTVLMLPMLGMLAFYYPARVILSAWLPQYADSLSYMALLFPLCIFESKMSMLIETYMKTLRKEKWLLLVNLSMVILSVISTGITVYWLHNLDLTIASIVVLLALRCVFAELVLARGLEIRVKTEIVWELMLTVIFIGCSWFIGGIPGLWLYLIVYMVYVIHKRRDVSILYQYMKQFL